MAGPPNQGPGTHSDTPKGKDYGPKPNPRAILTAHGWVDPPYTPKETADFKKRNKGKTTPGKNKNKPGDWSHMFGTAAGGDASTTDYLEGMPGITPMSAFPTFDYDTLNDGSAVGADPKHPFKPGVAALLDPSKWADQVGGKAYQPIIDALTKRVGGLQAGVGEANSMLDKSFGDGSTAALAGAQRIQEGTQKSNLGLTDLAARMAQVAGGDPLAAAAVGQATANQQGANTEQANIASQAQADQAAAAQRDLGTAKLAYRGATDASITDLISKTAAAKTESSQARGKGIMDALGFNSGQKTEQLGRDVSSQEAWLAGQLAGVEITKGKLGNEGMRAGLKLQKHGAQVNDWTAIESAKQTQYINRVTKWTDKNVAKRMMEEMKAGKQPKAELALADGASYDIAKQEIIGASLSKDGPLVDPGKIFNLARSRMTALYGDSDPKAIRKLAQLFAQEQINSWNAHHKDGQKVSGNTWKWVNGAPALVKIKST